MEKRHYIYRIEEKITGEFYWGVRTCKCNPKEDKYMGSMKAWKPNKNNLIKTEIIEYPTREIANKFEILIITEKINNKLNRNYNIPPHKFNTEGIKFSDEHNKKLSKALKGRIPWNKGKKMSDKTKQKISDSKKGKIPWNKGKNWDNEMLEKLSKSHKGHKPWNKGIPRTEKFKKEHSERMRRIKQSEETILKKTNSMRKIKGKKIICITTNKIFNSIAEAGEYYNLNYSTIQNRIKRKSKSVDLIFDYV